MSHDWWSRRALRLVCALVVAAAALPAAAQQRDATTRVVAATLDELSVSDSFAAEQTSIVANARKVAHETPGSMIENVR